MEKPVKTGSCADDGERAEDLRASARPGREEPAEASRASGGGEGEADGAQPAGQSPTSSASGQREGGESPSASGDEAASAQDSPADDTAAAADLPDERALRIEQLQEQVAKLGDDLALARADHYNLNKEYSAFVRRQKGEAPRQREAGQREVLEALLSVLDDIQAAREHGDLQGPFAAIAKKLEAALRTGFKVERYGEAGQEFDPALHDALMANESPDVEVATIAQVIQPGYRMGEQVLRPTKVMVNNPA